MSKIAVIKTGGKQYIVKEKQELKIEKLPVEENGKVVFDSVLMIANEDGKVINLGTPLVEGAKVEAKVLEQGRDKKIRVTHYKSKTRQHTVNGHRQPFTKVIITKIS